jgi:hypothetical protein
MVTVFLSAIIAASLTFTPAKAPSDTTNRYYINDELVENFDGSQIVGHKIKAYRIDDIKARKQVVRIHRISTEIVEPRYILNTIRVSKAMVDSVINTGNVSSIKVFKGIETGSLIVIKTKDQAAKEEEFKRLSQIKAKEYKEKLKREGRRN